MIQEKQKLTAEIKSFARDIGADLIGIAGIDRFEGVPAENHPSSIFPEAKSVIIVGKRIVRGALRGIEEGTQFGNYSLYGYKWLEDRFLAMCTFKIAEFIEANQWEAVPILNLPTQIPPMGISVAEGRPEPNVLVDVAHAAVRAGLGEIGYLDVFITPEFGPRQRLQAIITDADLVEDDLMVDGICDRSKALAEVPPVARH